jgi:SagB-type dehydrogenase family enzyme
MVSGAALARVGGALDRLEVASPDSRVRAISYPVDPMARFRGTRPFATPPGLLRSTGALLEWAYGYRPDPARGRLARRSPSAGALYPTETFVLGWAGDRWRLLHYDYRAHEFWPVPGSSPGAIAEQLGLERATTCVLVTSVLWRSVQRYGARGYLYCVLDAGHVAANLARAARDFGYTVTATATPPTRAVERALKLRSAEGLMTALCVRSDGRPAEVAPPPALSVPASGPDLLEPPPLSTLLRRTARFHERTLDPADAGLPAGRVAMTMPRGGLDARRSAAAFAPDVVDAARFEAIVAHFADALDALGDGRAKSLEAHVVVLRVGGEPTACRPLRGHGRGRPLATAADAAAELRAACQGQAVAGAAAFALVLGTPAAALRESGHREFRVAALRAGAVCAALYAKAAQLGLGTTSIGGFSAAAIGALVGEPSLWPLAVQVYGVDRPSRPKADQARIITLKRDRTGGTSWPRITL